MAVSEVVVLVVNTCEHLNAARISPALVEILLESIEYFDSQVQIVNRLDVWLGVFAVTYSILVHWESLVAMVFYCMETYRWFVPD